VGLLSDVGRGPVALDTAIFIYLIEDHARYRRVLRPLLRAIDEGRVRAVTSDLTLLETLVVPYRVGDVRLAERYEAILTGSRNLEVVPLARPLLRAAAALRAATGAKTPDAIQVAAALSRRSTALLTNDRDMPRLPDLRVLQLDDYV
jgi:predicted nucleic acid-binding protein